LEEFDRVDLHAIIELFYDSNKLSPYL